MNLLKSYKRATKRTKVLSLIKKIIFPGLLGILLTLNIVLIRQQKISQDTNVIAAKINKSQAQFSDLAALPVDTYEIKNHYWRAKVSFHKREEVINWIKKWEYDLCSLSLKQGVFELEIGAEFTW
ncbi:MAG TPA: hypothetical protein VIG45_03330 [Erysipelothrix sp.]